MKIADTFRQWLRRLPGIAEIAEKSRALEQKEARLALEHARLDLLRVKFNSLVEGALALQERGPDSVDRMPWRHPFLTRGNIQRFREYSEGVWEWARNYAEGRAPIRCAFAVNMAQNMYKWARLAQEYGAEAVLFPNVMDCSALSRPEWEEFDGEWEDLTDGAGFVRAHPGLSVAVPCRWIPVNGTELYAAYQLFYRGTRTPLLRLMADSPGLRHEVLLTYAGFYPYFQPAKALSEFDVIYAASTPFVAYASGRPYCVFSVGGDLQEDSGRGDELGCIMHLAFNAARFLMISNPHGLGHSRRLGLINGVYLPYPMDDRRYCPGEGRTRREWDGRFGKGVYVLSSARLDCGVKGHSSAFFHALVDLLKRCPELRIVFLAWGTDAGTLKKEIAASGMQSRLIMLPPVGKKRLLDYYRSCDIVLDHFVYGYFGATALEAAAVGKPLVMKLRLEQYEPLYAGDLPPVANADTPEEICQQLLRLVESAQARESSGGALREWLVRNHGEARTVPLLLALLRAAANRSPLPPDLVSPLRDDETEEERRYHEACRQVRS